MKVIQNQASFTLKEKKQVQSEQFRAAQPAQQVFGSAVPSHSASSTSFLSTSFSCCTITFSADSCGIVQLHLKFLN
jgi:hypothetical protein